MGRTTALYGVWAAICAALTVLPFSLLLDGMGRSAILRYASEVVVATGITAAFGWEVFHHQGRQPSGRGYCLLAVLVVLVTHLMFFGQVAIDATHNIADAFVLLSRPLILHGWFTIPVALLGTFLFVAARRRFAKAGPSGPSDARSRS